MEQDTLHIFSSLENLAFLLHLFYSVLEIELCNMQF